MLQWSSVAECTQTLGLGVLDPLDFKISKRGTRADKFGGCVSDSELSARRGALCLQRFWEWQGSLEVSSEGSGSGGPDVVDRS